MSSSGEPPSVLGDNADLIYLDRAEEADDWQDASGFARIGVWALPVALVHLALLWTVIGSAFDFRLPAFLHVDKVFAWLWVNGAAIGLGAWFWKKGRIPLAAGKWLRGGRVRGFILLWLGASLAWFLLPAAIGELWRMLSTPNGGW